MRVALVVLLLASGCRLEPPAPDPGLEADSVAAPRRALEDAAPPALEADPGATRDLDDATRATSRGDRLLVPVVGVPPGDLVDTFWAARSEGRSHDAIDIMAPRGRPVVAAAAGRVVRLFTSDKGGITAYVVGLDEETVYYYAHLDAYANGLEDGDVLDQGDPIGTVGDTGNATPGNTHLHFAVWRTDDPADFWDGEPVNPYPLLAGE